MAAAAEKFRCCQIQIPFTAFTVRNTGNDLVISGSVGQSQFRDAGQPRALVGQVFSLAGRLL